MGFFIGIFYVKVLSSLIIKDYIMDNKIVLTGIKPTGTPHIGNYLGALKPLIEMSQNHKTVMFIADLHALNAIHDAKVKKKMLG